LTEQDVLWEKAKLEFPGDPALAEVHYARLKIHEETKDMAAEEFINYIRERAHTAH